MIYNSISDAIGNTPLIRLSKIEKVFDIDAEIYAKLESMNPGGSAKDRVALNMIKRGGIIKGMTIIEPTSGNTGIGLAMIAAAEGINAVFTMPDTMSPERIKLFHAYGAKVVTTPGKFGMQGAVDKALELKKDIDGAVILGQFTNEANPEAHELATGPEIVKDLGTTPDVFVAGIGTGGTITGVGRFLKTRKKSTAIIGIEPASSPLLTKGVAGAHKIQGIGANFVPEILDKSVIDEVVTVSDESAFKFMEILGKEEGIFAGISSGAAISAIVDVCKQKNLTGKKIVTVLPDTGERYVSLLD